MAPRKGAPRVGVNVWTWRNRLVDHGPKGGQLLTLLAMLRWMDTQGNCHPSQETIAKATGQARETVNRNIKKSEAEGWLHIEHWPIEGKRGYYRNDYSTTVPKWVELTDKDEEITDAHHSCAGDVGEDYEDACVDAPPSTETSRNGYGNVTAGKSLNAKGQCDAGALSPQNHVTNDENCVTTQAEPCDASLPNCVTVEPHKHATKHPNERASTEGPALRASPISLNPGWSLNQEHEPTNGGGPQALKRVLQGRRGEKPTNGAAVNGSRDLKAEYDALCRQRGYTQ